jgi:putative membrane protein
MKKLSLIMMVALSASIFQACNNGAKTDSKESADSANHTKDTTTTGTTGIAVDKDDAKFATDAANGGMAEVAVAKVAEQKAVNPQVKKFAEMMVKDHSKANEELMAIAKTKNITLPAEPSEDKQKELKDLSAKSTTDFDKAYVDAMVDGHKKTISMFEDAAKNCKDADLKAFATNTLPIIKGHLTEIEAIKKGMK